MDVSTMLQLFSGYQLLYYYYYYYYIILPLKFYLPFVWGEGERQEKSTLLQGSLESYILCAGTNRILPSRSGCFNDM